MSSESEAEGYNNDITRTVEIHRLSKDDKRVLREANELLNSLEHTHRNDLALHLYSAFLLKSTLKAANRRKFASETSTFIKTQIKDNWTSWPNVNTVIDPQTNLVFEDSCEDNHKSPQPLQTGEISPAALDHAMSMVHAELNATWQRALGAMASEKGITLDIDRMDIPCSISTAIMDKIDHFFNGLHAKVATTTKLKLSQITGSSQLEISEAKPKKAAEAMNRKIKLDYRDIIIRGCQMGEDMHETYLKALELYQDIPSHFRKNEFKLPKRELRKYSSKSRRSEDSPGPHKTSRKGYVNVEKLLKQNRLTFESRSKLRSTFDRDRQHAIDKMTFLWVKGFEEEQKEPSRKEDGSNNLSQCYVDDYIVPFRRSKVPRKHLRKD